MESGPIIVIEYRNHGGSGYYVRIRGTKCWDCGHSTTEAVQKLIRSWPEKFGITNLPSTGIVESAFPIQYVRIDNLS